MILDLVNPTKTNIFKTTITSFELQVKIFEHDSKKLTRDFNIISHDFFFF